MNDKVTIGEPSNVVPFQAAEKVEHEKDKCVWVEASVMFGKL